MKRLSLLIAVALLGCFGCAALRQTEEWEVVSVVEYATGKREAIRIAIEKNGGVWVAYPEGVFAVIKARIPKVYSVSDFKEYYGRSRYRYPVISVLQVDPLGRVWIGTEEGLYTLMRDGKWHKSRIAESKEPLRRQLCEINSFVACLDGTIWVSADGLRRVTVAGNKVNFSSLCLDLDAGSMALGTDGRIWMCIPREGIGVFDGEKLEKVYGIEEGLISRSMRQVLVDSEGNVWALDGGVSVLEEDAWTTIVHESALGSGNATSLAVSPDGKVWVGTANDGLFVYDRAGLFLKHYTVENGLPGNSVRDVEVSADGDIWIATNNGIAVHRDSGKAM